MADNRFFGYTKEQIEKLIRLELGIGVKNLFIDNYKSKKDVFGVNSTSTLHIEDEQRNNVDIIYKPNDIDIDYDSRPKTASDNMWDINGDYYDYYYSGDCDCIYITAVFTEDSEDPVENLVKKNIKMRWLVNEGYEDEQHDDDHVYGSAWDITPIVKLIRDAINALYVQEKKVYKKHKS